MAINAAHGFSYLDLYLQVGIDWERSVCMIPYQAHWPTSHWLKKKNSFQLVPIAAGYHFSGGTITYLLLHNYRKQYEESIFPHPLQLPWEQLLVWHPHLWGASWIWK
jgi:hypothetical protein